MGDKISRYISLGAGVILFALFCALMGYSIADKKTALYFRLQEIRHIVGSLISYGEVIGEGLRVPAPAGAARDPATLRNPDQAMGEGYYAIMAWDGARSAYSIFLRDAAGTLVHTWPIDEKAMSDKAEHYSNAPHAMEALPDGSVVMSFDHLGLMARLDACGAPIWQREGYFHHSFSPSADGGLWTWYGAQSGYGQLQDILKFDPLTGKDITRLSLRDDVILRTPDSATLFSMHPDFPFTPDDQNPRDIFHPNDVEELLPERAAAFPRFKAGDLMLSIRELDMVAVIDPTGAIKWLRQGPWLKQHDPDFEADGTITVYDNARGRPRSMLMAVNPETGHVTNALPQFDGAFKSAYRGKHQRLPNGNTLLTIPEQGQALEIAPDGTVALEFNNVAQGFPEMNDDLVNAKWLPADFFESLPACSD